MTVVIVIDESGDLGEHSTPYFAMAALVMVRPRHMATVAKMIPDGGREVKWSNSNVKFREKLFQEMARCHFRAVYTVVNKSDRNSSVHLFGNDLYEFVLRRVIADAMEVYPQHKDVEIIVDRSRFISLEKLRAMSTEEAKAHGINPTSCEKKTSNQSKCIQIVDFIAGSARSRFEDGDITLEHIREMLSVARKY